MVLKNSFIKHSFALTSNSSWVQELTNFAPEQSKTGEKETNIQLNKLFTFQGNFLLNPHGGDFLNAIQFFTCTI